MKIWALKIITVIIIVSVLVILDVKTNSEFIFTAAGDHGFSNKKVTKNSKAAMDTVANSGSDFYIALGDLSFKVGSEKEWCEIFKSKFNYVELIAGNHDTGEVDGGNIDNYRVHCPFVLPDLANPVLVGDYGKRYYFDYPQTNLGGD